MAHLLSGVTVPLVTPLTIAQEIDHRSLLRMIDHVVAGGVHNIFLFGSNGEFSAFGVEELAECVATARKHLDHIHASQHLFVGIGSSSPRDTLARAHAARAAGADALVACPPFYFIYKPDEIIGYFRHLGDALDIPLILYNIPRYTQNPLTPEMVAELASHPRIIGIKDSSGDENQILALLEISRQHPHFAVNQGNEAKLLWALSRQVHGITPGLANIVPSLCVDLWQACAEGRSEDAALAIQQRLLLLTGIHAIRSGIGGTKAALALLGLCEPIPAKPFIPLNAAETKLVADIMSQVGLTIYGGISVGHATSEKR